jgi:hypothetical protein
MGLSFLHAALRAADNDSISVAVNDADAVMAEFIVVAFHRSVG